MALLYLLYKNNKWLKMEPDELYKMAVDVAQSRPEYKEEITRLVQKMLQINLVSRIE